MHWKEAVSSHIIDASGHSVLILLKNLGGKVLVKGQGPEIQVKFLMKLCHHHNLLSLRYRGYLEIMSPSGQHY